ncbi:hypothetical protein BB560_002698 [Smittium megazygosporum]|uniref:Small ribosomal subunit protein uS5m n=1 Tax=Smittium megazygosporum TaxID=133381 RepID=A0A2T9ZE21_9FUNG|nr:hypothetical protein BB560_002698 [Smittium megazygosporum]
MLSLRSNLFSVSKNALRSFSTNSVVLQRKARIKVSEAEKLPDLSKIDPIYDDIEENESVINLWRSQLIKEKNLLNMKESDKQNLEAELNEAHGLVYPRFPFKLPLPKNPDYENPEFFESNELLWSKDLGISLEEFSNLTKKVLVVRRTVQMTQKGKIPSMTVLVVVGNTRGSAGYGEGKSDQMQRAISIATRKAIKNMTFFPRYDNRTIYHNIHHVFKSSSLHFWARRPGFGLKVNPVIHEVCKCIGIKDLAGKCKRSRNPLNVIKGAFEALSLQRTPEFVSRSRGVKMVDVQKTYYGIN